MNWPWPTASGIIPARAGFTRPRLWVSSRAWDHPRSRGVYSTRSPARSGWRGSSPLARGLRSNPPPWTSSRRDHPRSRGVYGRAFPPPTPGAGSSPLARGLHAIPVPAEKLPRIIPARAGFTGVQRAPAHSPADHPRSRGVYSRAPSVGVTAQGSSPLARGLRGRGWSIDHEDRIIPARAGFTTRRRTGPRWSEDHPRSRGVYSSQVTPPSMERGSSPLARGLLADRVAGVSAGGIIPARAGFTWPPPRLPRRSWDHPRSRGVYRSPLIAFRAVRGSSPLARGLRMMIHAPDIGSVDHLRSRGVYPSHGRMTRTFPGSSPLARGLPPRSATSTPRPGIIPARAGFTARRSSTTHRGEGSSPLARGLLLLPDERSPRLRIIPARAGFTTRRRTDRK